MSRILVVSSFAPPPDGIADHTARLVQAWEEAGNDVLVLAQGSAARSEVEPIGPRSSVARLLRAFPRDGVFRFARSFKPDVVFVQFAVPALGARLFSTVALLQKLRAAGVPVVVGFHESSRDLSLLRQIGRAMYRHVARVTTCAIVFSASEEATLRDLGFDRVVVVPHGANTFEEPMPEELQRVRRKYAIEKPLVLNLGFTHPDKGVDLLVRAIPLITQKTKSNVQFIISGTPRKRTGVFKLFGLRDSHHRRHLEALLRELDYEHSASLYGYLPSEDVVSLLFVADVVALPYRKITQSGVANLALSAGVPVAASNLAGLVDTLGDAALYAPIANVEQFAICVERILGDPDVARSLREHGLARRVLQGYDVVALQILQTVLEVPEGSP